VGAIVVWTHAGQRKHTVTSEDGWIKSGTLDAGAVFKQTFEQPGIYPYFCEVHGADVMSGIIRVGDGGTYAAPAPPAEAPQAAPPPAPAPAPVEVSMKDFEFGPKELTVKAGTTVTWKNDGAKPHSATASDGSFDTGLYEPGAAKSVTFASPGTFDYYCQLHGTPDGNGMVGKVVVE
jgi:plastocyanin